MNILTAAFTRTMLGREEHEFSIWADQWRGRSVLVTGAGGFIGAELCDRLCKANAGQVVAVENNELALVNLMRKVPVHGELADIRNSRRMTGILRAKKPDIVIHAAAYKHVPLLEQFPFEAMENNAIAAWRMTELAASTGVGRFLLVSTDKAVDPVSMLGLSKRLAELAVVHARSSGTLFAAVRCGNVLGSPGSVIPCWIEERSAGLPLTVTDPEAERFFVSRGEAAGALLRVLEMPDGAGLFTYALKKAVTVWELANRLSMVLKDDSSVNEVPQLRTVGLAAGERRQEALHGCRERVSATECPQILRVETCEDAAGEIGERMREVEAACEHRDRDALLLAVEKAIRR